MADLALYRKYRPTKFNNLVGQHHVQKTLLNAIKSGHLAHAYLFCGPRGTGKTTTARLIAKAMNCISPEPDGESCNQCQYCLLMNQGTLMDLIEIDAASNRGIDEIRDLRDKIQFSPTQAPHKIYIIDEVHMLTTPAFNALLKTLEEPPSHAYFILATTEVHKIPETILSRCQRFDFRRIEENTIVDRLKHIAQQEGIECEEAALQAIARKAEGGLRDAIVLLEQVVHEGRLTHKEVQDVLGLSGQGSVQNLFQALEKEDLKAALIEIQTLHQEGHDLYQFNREFLEFVRLQLLGSIGNVAQTQKYLHWVDVFQKTSLELKNTLIAQLPLEIAVIKTIQGKDMDGEEKSGFWSNLLKSKKDEPSKEEGGLRPLPEETKEVEKTSEPIVEAKSENFPPLTLDQVRAHFSNICDAISIPSIRQSFKTGVIQTVEGSKVHVQFQSKFHLEKVGTLAHRLHIESAFESLFGSKIQLECSLVPVENLVEKTLEIFGGEVVE